MFAYLASGIFHFCQCYVYTFVFKMDIEGVSLATCATYFMNLSILTIYCLTAEDVKGHFLCITSNTIRGIKDYLKIAIPSMVMLIIEWSGTEILSLLAGRLGTI